MRGRPGPWNLLRRGRGRPRSRSPPGGAPADAQPDARPDAEPNARPDAQPNGQPDAEPNAEPSAQPNGQPDAEPNAEPNAQPDGQRNAARDANARLAALAAELEDRVRPKRCPGVSVAFVLLFPTILWRWVLVLKRRRPASPSMQREGEGQWPHGHTPRVKCLWSNCPPPPPSSCTSSLLSVITIIVIAPPTQHSVREDACERGRWAAEGGEGRGAHANTATGV